MNWQKFSDWVKVRESKLQANDDGKPRSPRGMEKVGWKQSKHCRTHEDDLSGDYKGHIAHNGEIEPFGIVKKTKSKAVADVAK